MKNKERLFWIGGVVVLVIIFIIFLLKPRDNGTYFKQLLDSKDSTISVIWGEREELKRRVAELDAQIESNAIADSILNEIYLSNQKIHKQLDAKLNQIPIDIDAISGNKDSIRARFNKF